MFSKIVVALNDLPEAQRSLHTATDVARSFDAKLTLVSVLGNLPAYAAFAIAFDPDAPDLFRGDRRDMQMNLHENATRLAGEHCVRATSAVIKRRDARATLRFLKDEKADRLVIGLHQHDVYQSRLWTAAYDLARDAPCSVLGVH